MAEFLVASGYWREAPVKRGSVGVRSPLQTDFFFNSRQNWYIFRAFVLGYDMIFSHLKNHLELIKINYNLLKTSMAALR